MTKVPDISGIEKYSERKFKSSRLRKKQTTTLVNYCKKLSRRSNLYINSLSFAEEMPVNALLLFKIRLIKRGIEVLNETENMTVVPAIIEGH